MSNAVINDSIAFLSNPFTRSVAGLNTTVFESIGGTQQAIKHNSRDLRSYNISLDSYERSEASTFIDFYLERNGSFESFLFVDEKDFQVNQTLIGVGDGAEDEFQLIQLVGTTSFDRWNIIASSVTVWVDLSVQTEGIDYVLGYTDSGLITFQPGSIPPNLKDVHAEFKYYRRCRFTSGMQDTEVGYEFVNMNMSFKEFVPNGV